MTTRTKRPECRECEGPATRAIEYQRDLLTYFCDDHCPTARRNDRTRPDGTPLCAVCGDHNYGEHPLFCSRGCAQEAESDA